MDQTTRHEDETFSDRGLWSRQGRRGWRKRSRPRSWERHESKLAFIEDKLKEKLPGTRSGFCSQARFCLTNLNSTLFRLALTHTPLCLTVVQMVSLNLNTIQTPLLPSSPSLRITITRRRRSGILGILCTLLSLYPSPWHLTIPTLLLVLGWMERAMLLMHPFLTT